MEEQRVYTIWLCSSALGTLLAFLPVPRFAWAAALSIIFGWYAYKGLLTVKARRVFFVDAVCNAVVGLTLFFLALSGVLSDNGRIATVSIFVCVTVAVCWHIYKLEEYGQRDSPRE